MLSKKVQNALNDQLNKELVSSYLYLSLSSLLEEKNLSGMAAWMKAQAGEELGHAMKLYGYILERDGSVELKPVAVPEGSYKTPKDIFKAAYAHEQYITKSINKVFEISQTEKDFATNGFLQWFINEQVEEEASTKAVVDKLELVSDHPGGLFMMDRELGGRGAAPQG